jgi:hypothetical protein
LPGPLVHGFFLASEQIKEQCPYSVRLKDAGYVAVSGAVPAAATAMGEQYESTCPLRQAQHSFKNHSINIHGDQTLGSVSW